MVHSMEILILKTKNWSHLKLPCDVTHSVASHYSSYHSHTNILTNITNINSLCYSESRRTTVTPKAALCIVAHVVDITVMCVQQALINIY